MSTQANKPAKVTLSWREIHEELRPRGKIDNEHWVADVSNLFAGPVRRLVKSRKRNANRKDVMVLNSLTKKERRCVFKNAIPCPREGVILRRGTEFYKEIRRDYRGATYEIVGSAQVQANAAPSANTTSNAAPRAPTVPTGVFLIITSKSGLSLPNLVLLTSKSGFRTPKFGFANFQIWVSISQIRFSNSQIWFS